MKPCSNPTCTHQVEDDARFCGMCGTYVGPEMTSDTTLADAQVKDRIQQCRDLINSLQSESDEKEKAQKIRTVMNIVTSINTNQLPSKPIALVAEQIQVLSIVVQEVITLPSISPTASAADIQHWPISPLEMRQWTERLIALNGSNNFSSLDKATKSAVRDALGRFISFVGINARSNPDTELFLLDLYESITALSAPELQSCFLGINRSKLLRRLGQRIGSSLVSVSADEVRMFGKLAAETLSELGMSSTHLESDTNAALGTLAQLARSEQTQLSILAPSAEAYVALLQMQNHSAFSRMPDASSRTGAVDALLNTAEMMSVNYQPISTDVITLLSENLPAIIRNVEGVSPGDRAALARRYIKLAVNESDPQKKEALVGALRNFAACLNWLRQDDPSIGWEFSNLMHNRLGL